MHIDEIRQAYRREPFAPFELELHDGRRLRVLLRQRIALSPIGDSVFVVTPDDHGELVRMPEIKRMIAWVEKQSA